MIKIIRIEKNTLELEPSRATQICMENIISFTKPGMTFMYIKSVNIQGYQDDTKEVIVYKKEASLKILSFQ